MIGLLAPLLGLVIGLPVAVRDKASDLVWNRHVELTMGPKPIVITAENADIQFDGTSWYDGQGNPILPLEAWQTLFEMGFRSTQNGIMRVTDAPYRFNFDGGGVMMDAARSSSRGAALQFGGGR